jgi:hypothetical protein
MSVFRMLKMMRVLKIRIPNWKYMLDKRDQDKQTKMLKLEQVNLKLLNLVVGKMQIMV